MRFGPFGSKGRRRSSFFNPSLTFEQLEQRLALTGSLPTISDVYVSGTLWTSGFKAAVNPQAPELGFRIPTGSSAQTSSLPWTNINRITVKFNEDVNVESRHLSLSGVSATNFPSANFFYDAMAHTATWTLTTPLPTNTYLLRLDGTGLKPVADLNGNRLDGEWTDGSSTTSGDQVQGGDFKFTFRVLPADVDQNGTVTTADYSATYARQGQAVGGSNYGILYDLNGSGAIDSRDAMFVDSRVGATYQSGSPVGALHNPPTSTGGQAITLTDPSITTAISLFDRFKADGLSSDSMGYTIISASNTNLFSTLSLDSNNGQLQMRPAAGQSGISEIVVKATDKWGLNTTATFLVNVNGGNMPPSITLQIVSIENDTFEVFVTVTDEQLKGLYVTFTGALNMRASVADDGTIDFGVVADPPDWGDVCVKVTDPFQEFDVATDYLGVT
jgi:hypothetical protein